MGVVLGEGTAVLSKSKLEGLGESCELPSGVRGGALTAQCFSTISGTEDGLSCHYC